MLRGANSTGKAVAKTKLANIKSKNARASLANITMLFPSKPRGDEAGLMSSIWKLGYCVYPMSVAQELIMPFLRIAPQHFSRTLTVSQSERGESCVRLFMCSNFNTNLNNIGNIFAISVALRKTVSSRTVIVSLSSGLNARVIKRKQQVI